jgi:hypothetical protein
MKTALEFAKIPASTVKTSDVPGCLSREWWVHSEFRASGHKSRVGPFGSAEKAAQFAEWERPASECRRVSISSRVTNGEMWNPEK